MLLKTLYSVWGDTFALLWEFGWIFQKYDNNRQKKLIFIILTWRNIIFYNADLAQSKKKHCQINLGLHMDTIIVNMKTVSVDIA